MNTRPNRNRGFTIVELLVVIGIIAILLALLAPALGGAIRRSHKFEETNGLREVAKAWNLYANAFSGAALPGYLEHDPSMQGPPPGWNVEYEYHTPAPGSTNIVIPQNIAAPWTWRLLPFLSYDHDAGSRIVATRVAPSTRCRALADALRRASHSNRPNPTTSVVLIISMVKPPSPVGAVTNSEFH